MSFTTLEFAAFMAVVYALYFALPHRWRNRLLLAASYFFYGWWDWRFLSLIAASTFIDHWVGRRLERSSNIPGEGPGTRRRLVMISLGFNLGMLGIFKYYNFFADSAERLAASLGIELHWTTTSLVLPVGISFYTFQTLSYTIDIYRGKLRPVRRLEDLALYVAFFPQLVAGPIERARRLLPQITRRRRFGYASLTRGAYLILLGLFKKLVIADGVAPSVDSIYGSSGSVSGLDVLLATYLFAVQIYCDFSGYSDIARGLSKTLGFELMVNFDQPYLSSNPREFWRRWHISLSTWLRDYLYVPLGGSRHGELRTQRNLLATMVLGGLWHGAAWNFVLWGTYQGLVLAAHRWWNGRWGSAATRSSGVGWAARVAVYFQVTCYGWLLFRAESLTQIGLFTRALLPPWSNHGLQLFAPSVSSMLGLGLLCLLGVTQRVQGSSHHYRSWPEPLRAGLYACLTLLMLMGLSHGSTQFVYFQF